MKIVFLQSSLWLSGGAIVVVEYANRLSEKGHEISIIIPGEAICVELNSRLSPNVKLIQTKQRLTKPLGLLAKIRLTLEMANRIPKSDLIITTHTPTSLATYLASSWMQKGTPIWFYMDYPGMFSDRPVEAWLLRNAMRWHKAAIVLSGHSALELAQITQKPIKRIGLGIDNVFLRHELHTKRSNTDNSKRVLYLGDFRPRKGFADFLAAVNIVQRSYRNIELLIALKEQGEFQTPIPKRVYFRPSNDELAELYSTCDVFVSTSWFEGFGLPPLEAMACSAPVVMTDSGGVSDYAKPNENCLLVPPKSPEQLAQAILRIIGDPKLAARLRKNGPPTAEEYSWSKAVERFENALIEFAKPSACG